MIVVLKQGASRKNIDVLTEWLNAQGIRTDESVGEFRTVLGLVGDTARLDADLVSGFDAVECVRRISEPYSLASRHFHPDDSVIDISGRRLGGGNFQIIAGPCSVESETQICSVAESVGSAGAGLLRGGAFKPRTSPYDFQGLHGEGLKMLSLAKKKTGLPVVSEIMSITQLPLFEDVDVIQVGARNMQNFELLKELGKTNKPILLKRGMSATVKELLTGAEYIMSGGNEKVILCERGIRSFEDYTRNTLDLSAVPVIHELSHLPVIVDPSHGTGKASLVPSMALAAVAAGADGLLIEVHNDPVHARSDGGQSLTLGQFESLVRRINAVREALK